MNKKGQGIKLSTLFIICWIICGVLAYGITLADFQKSYPTIAKEGCKKDMGFSSIIGVFGPFGLFTSFFMSGFVEDGLMFYCRGV